MENEHRPNSERHAILGMTAKTAPSDETRLEPARRLARLSRITKPNPFSYFKFIPKISRLTVTMYVRFYDVPE